MSRPFDLTRFHQLLATRSFGRNFIFEATTGSTMDMAREAAARGAPEGTVAAADEQTAGRGRLGRAWITPPAVNLTTTLVLRPPLDRMRQVAMIAPLAVAESIEEVAGLRAPLKWPNDVILNGRKVAGVLIETSVADDGAVTVLVGVGLNVNFDPRDHPEIRDIATSLRAELGRDADRELLLASYLLHFERMYEEALAGRSMRDRWRERLATLGHQVHVTWPGRTADGIAEDVTEDGSLVVRRADGSRITVEAGDVTLRA
ncbi:MAG TPA: biotin--[acetyl-CoA-carboxylase] ligase [Dehalococcoidia bacterium]|nr:biotin--[acetyl-CoA-carboxylase] ligase [Dehalococcoidia bacterium]